MTIDEIIKHCDDYITSMNKYADTGNIGWWLEFYHTVLSGFRELKALKAQQPTVDTRQRERQLEMEYQHGYDKGWEEGRKALEQQPSLRDKLEKEYLVESLTEDLQKLYAENEELRKKLEQEPCEDCISREALLSKIKEVCFSENWVQFRSDNGSNGQRDFLINYIEHLPSVTPQRQKGKWIDFNWNDGDICRWGIKCSECHTEYKHGGEMWHNPKFCPNCGAEMEGEEDV